MASLAKSQVACVPGAAEEAGGQSTWCVGRTGGRPVSLGEQDWLGRAGPGTAPEGRQAGMVRNGGSRPRVQGGRCVRGREER